MARPTVAETSPALPADVIAFATEQGVAKALPKVLEMTKRIFPSARRLQVFLEPDPEIADLTFIVFEVEVAGLEVSQAVEAQWQWCRELSQCCPAAREVPIVLGMNLVE